MDAVAGALDCFKEAVLLAREVDVESEAIALSMLGKGERRGTACRFVVGVGRGTFAQGLQPDGRA